jgi:16S rRNA (guanine527-N7)-methyltransferase
LSAATSSARADDGELAGLVSTGAAQLNLPLPVSEVRRLVEYVRLIERWNATYNLTAVRDPRDMVTHHILDCLAAAAALIRRRGAGRGERLVDVGSGAGLPGIVVAMASPDREVTCVDSVGKKAAFITQAAGSLGLENVQVVHARIEDVPGRFDIVASRAFASLKDFVGATGPVLDPAGGWMAMKGKIPEAELELLGPGLTFHVEPLIVPHLRADRCVVWIERTLEASAHS